MHLDTRPQPAAEDHGRDDLADMLRLARRVRHRELARHQRWQDRHRDCDNRDEISRAHRRLDAALRTVADELTNIAAAEVAIHRMRCLPHPPAVDDMNANGGAALGPRATVSGRGHR